MYDSKYDILSSMLSNMRENDASVEDILDFLSILIEDVRY